MQDRNIIFEKRPDAELVVEFASTELSGEHLNFDRANIRGAFLGFPGIRASGGKITFTKSLFESSAISFWNADLHGECEIEIQPHPNLSIQDVTVLYSQVYAGLNGRVTLGTQVKLLEVSGAD